MNVKWEKRIIFQIIICEKKKEKQVSKGLLFKLIINFNYRFLVSIL
jgi:hypothetical protein